MLRTVDLQICARRLCTSSPCIQFLCNNQGYDFAKMTKTTPLELINRGLETESTKFIHAYLGTYGSAERRCPGVCRNVTVSPNTVSAIPPSTHCLSLWYSPQSCLRIIH
uniref:(northern house mosquito) hypothetical protein n=1 Tax=Culex pipiens TaxID=7175 RepID=A0A8D8FQV1_CULPI